MQMALTFLNKSKNGVFLCREGRDVIKAAKKMERIGMFFVLLQAICK